MSRLLPDRHTPVNKSLLAQVARLNAQLPEVSSVAHAWSVARDLYPQQPFSRFVLMLDVLAALGRISLEGDLLVKVVPNAAKN